MSKPTRISLTAGARSDSVSAVFFEDTLLAVWRHGWQRRGQDFTEVLEETTDQRKIHRLVQSDRCG